MSSPPLPAPPPLAPAALSLQPLLDAMAAGQGPESLLALALRLGAEAAGTRDAVCLEVTGERGLRARHWLRDGVVLPAADLADAQSDRRALLEELAQGLRVPRAWLQALERAGLAGEPADDALAEGLPSVAALCVALGFATPACVPVVLDGTLAAVLVLFVPAHRRAALEPAALLEAALPLRLVLAGRRLAGHARRQALASARADAQDAAARAGDLARTNAALRLSIEKLSTQQGLTAALVAIAEAALHVVQADAGGIGLLDARGVVRIHPIDPDPATGEFRRGAPVEVVLEGTSWRWWQQLEAAESCWWVATGGDALTGLAVDAQRWHAERGHRRVVHLPLRLDGEVVGFLGFCFKSADPPPAERIETMRVLADQATLGARVARLGEAARDAALARESARRANERVELLRMTAAITQSLSGTTDLAADLPRVLGMLGVATGTDRAAVLLERETVDGPRHEVFAEWANGGLAAQRDSAAAVIPNALLPVELVTALQAGRSSVVVVTDDPHPFMQAQRTLGATVTGACGLFVDGRYVGALTIALCRPHAHWTEAQLLAMETAAHGIGAALQQERTIARHAAALAAVAQEEERAALAYAAELAEGNQLLEASISRLAESGVPELFLDHVLLAAASVADADETGLMLLTADRQAIALRRVFARTAPDASPAACPLGSRSPAIALDALPAWEALQAGREVLLEPLPPALQAHWPTCCRPPARALCVPVRLGTAASGCLVLGLRGSGPVPPRRVALARAFADQAALALAFMRFAAAAEEAAVAEERNRLARDIHDTLAQCLTGVIMQLQAAGALATEKPDVASECIGRAEAMARAGLAEARRSVRALRDDGDTTLDLADALRETAARMTTGTGVTAEVTMQGRPRALGGGAAMQLLRIGQEAFTNAVRHAAATRIHLAIEYAPAYVRLTVTDDGRGFTTGAGAGGPGLGFGLIGMRQRAERIGARLRITSTPAAGTTLECLLPVGDAEPTR